MGRKFGFESEWQGFVKKGVRYRSDVLKRAFGVT